MRSKDDLFLLFILALAVGAGYEYYKLPFQEGIDISGGRSVTYKMDLSKLPEEGRPNSALYQDNVVRLLSKDLQGPLGLTEARVEPIGNDQIVVEFPEDADRAQAREGGCCHSAEQSL